MAKVVEVDTKSSVKEYYNEKQERSGQYFFECPGCGHAHIFLYKNRGLSSMEL